MDGQFTAQAWDAASARVEVGKGTREGEKLHIQLSENGRAIIALPVSRVAARNYPFLHLAFSKVQEKIGVTILWRTAQSGQEVHSYQVTPPIPASLWLTGQELTGWSGDITSLGVALRGRAGDAVTVTDVSISPASLAGRLRIVFANWAGFTPWQHTSANTHYVVRPTATALYPVPVAAIYFALSVLAYALLVLLFRRTISFDWRIVAGLFLACWISLDLLWQQKLLRQLGYTYETFAGKNTPAKLAAGLDASLVKFVAEVKRAIASPGSRVFVGSKDDYRGMRSAYYLYPLNVYWKRHGPELPRRKYLRSGDYIVLVEPTDIRFDPAKSDLHFSNFNRPLGVEPVFSRRQGSLYRVK